ncbi:MAG: glycerol-3-phosphate 1-O-acyltransferase PlsY [Candidatus Omnitrophota bacterium]|nr:glycerol-3-phosphate 1-O-acyltransferase PlsY [Candidatus Omnitrophota bacterium]
MPWIVCGILVSYLIGSIPTAYIFVRLLKGQDIRSFGSGNVGATNAARVIGRGWGITVLALDVLKGYVSVALVGAMLASKVTFISTEMFQITLGVASVIGHVWTVFLKFKGGKGVACTLGVLLALSVTSAVLRPILGLTLLTWVVVFAAARIVSLASILACVSFPIYMAIFRQPLNLVVATSILAAFIIFRHKSNLSRLFQRKERRLF